MCRSSKPGYSHWREPPNVSGDLEPRCILMDQELPETLTQSVSQKLNRKTPQTASTPTIASTRQPLPPKSLNPNPEHAGSEVDWKAWVGMRASPGFGGRGGGEGLELKEPLSAKTSKKSLTLHVAIKTQATWVLVRAVIQHRNIACEIRRRFKFLCMAHMKVYPAIKVYVRVSGRRRRTN